MSLNLKHEKTLQALARAHGIELRYRDGTGVVRVVSTSTLHALLHAMGVNVATDEEAHQSLKAVRLQHWTRALDQVFVVWQGNDSACWQFTVPISGTQVSHMTVAWQLVDEQGQQFGDDVSGERLSLMASRTIKGKAYCRLGVSFPNLLLGLNISPDPKSAQCWKVMCIHGS